MKQWYWGAAGALMCNYMAFAGMPGPAGWFAAGVMFVFAAVMLWIAEGQQKLVRELLRMLEERADLQNEEVGTIADMAGYGPQWRAARAVAIARVKAKQGKEVAHG